ncbi:aliphatic sulfonate ABC transporter substrate-binding protein [Scytonema hofmannii PCC 7110]|uniref:Putative aliphatic sulfonates-binding protein n=1 Tax=Scytonema hofmannii PCC 7110 TaxID=128403 RepID=A0A139X2G6_9CYAN|nr:aliphatic sulfonate ABC transporter substrate-binding protein [Scytonema hofmannii]KYC38901.1 aliphatic sulfonate ABC transporter substrate-binding protein [Scytonema hofmannii PCC 7110]
MTSIKRRHILTLSLSTVASFAYKSFASTHEATSNALDLAQANPGSTNTGKNASKLRLGFQPPYVTVFAMREQKLLEKAFEGQPTSFEYRRLLSLKPVTEALAAGALDLGLGGTPIPALAAGLPIRIIALIERSPKTHALLVRPDSPIKNIKDLKDKKIGTPTGRSHLLVVRVLESIGLKDTDVKWVQLEKDVGRAALLSGAIDVWATWDPFYASVQVAKEAIAIVDGTQYVLNYVALFGRTEYIEQNPDTVRRFLKAYQQAVNWVKQNRQKAVEILVRENKLAPEAAALTLSRRNILLQPPNQEYRTDLANQAKLLVRLGLIKQEPDWSQVIDTKFAASIRT